MCRGEDQFRFVHGQFDYVDGHVNDRRRSRIINFVRRIARPVVFGVASRMEKQYGNFLSVEGSLVVSAATVMSAMDAQAPRVEAVEYTRPGRAGAVPDDG